MQRPEEGVLDVNNRCGVCFPDIEDAIIQQAMAVVRGAMFSEVGITTQLLNPDALAETVALVLLGPLRRLLHIVRGWRDDAFVIPRDKLRFDLGQLEQTLWEMQKLMSASFYWLSDQEIDAQMFMDMYLETRMHVMMVLCYVRLIERMMDICSDSYMGRYLQLLADRSCDLASYLVRVVETAPKLGWIIPPYFILGLWTKKA